MSSAGARSRDTTKGTGMSSANARTNASDFVQAAARDARLLKGNAVLVNAGDGQADQIGGGAARLLVAAAPDGVTARGGAEAAVPDEQVAVAASVLTGHLLEAAALAGEGRLPIIIVVVVVVDKAGKNGAARLAVIGGAGEAVEEAAAEVEAQAAAAGRLLERELEPGDCRRQDGGPGKEEAGAGRESHDNQPAWIYSV